MHHCRHNAARRPEEAAMGGISRGYDAAVRWLSLALMYTWYLVVIIIAYVFNGNDESTCHCHLVSLILFVMTRVLVIAIWSR